MNQESPSGLAPAAQHESDASRPLRVLIADDDHDTVLMLATLLRDEGFETKLVYRGDEVLKAMRDFAPDAALIDIGMPGSTGYEIARELRRRHGRHAPLLIAITAWNKPSDAILARLAGFDHHLGKPYDPNELVGLLQRFERRPPVEPALRSEPQATTTTFSGPLHVRLLQKAAEIVGGIDTLERRLLVPGPELAKWMAGTEPMPPAIFLRAVDILVETMGVEDWPPPVEGSRA